MPLFISDEELRLLGGDTAAVAERADAAIRELRRQVDTVRAEADAAAIAAEQTCALLEQRYASLSAEFDRSQAEAAELTAAAERRAAELASSQAEIHQLRIQAIAKDGEVERLKVEISELHKSKCQSLELIEQRDAEIKEKDGIIQSYYDKIVNLAEAKIQEVEAKFTHCQAMCTRITQEKELLEKHNLWLDEELKVKVKNLAEMRKTNMDEEARMSARIAELEREISKSSSSLRRGKERISELEQRVSYMEKELCSTKDAAAANEQRLGAELSTVMKLAELHKESSEEWSKKAGELEGVIKALETHLTQVEDEYKEIEKEALSRRDLEKEGSTLKQKLQKCEFDLEITRKSSELSLIPLTSVAANSADLMDTTIHELPISDEPNQNDLMVIPKVPSGVSGTALAASLLRDGWSLAKIYEKYQEATDALLHERRGRRHAEAVLERVLHEIEEKAELILDERAEHERMVEAYALMDQKLQRALLEHDNFENTIRNLKSELKRRERDHSVALKDIDDLQKQVKMVLDTNKRLEEDNKSLQQYNSNLQADAAKNAETIAKLLKEKNIMVETMNGLNLELDLAKSLQNEAALIPAIGTSKEMSGKTAMELDGVVTEILEETSLREIINTLEMKIAAGREKLKVAKLTALEECENDKKMSESIEKAKDKLLFLENKRRTLHDTCLNLKGKIRVFCRVRPLLSNQSGAVVCEEKGKNVGQGIQLMHKDQVYSFSFDMVFDHSASQNEVFEEISQLVQSSIDGNKVCIFAYGQTGSGKTYTMMGNPKSHDEKGMIPRSLEQIFKVRDNSQGWDYKMEVSILEIYNETIRDLLAAHDEASSEHTISHDASGNTHVTNLTIVKVTSMTEVSHILEWAANRRSVGSTHMNEKSSISHCVFTLRISGVDDKRQPIQGVLNLIDLAGSERASGDQEKETLAINSSLLHLSMVINAIANKEEHVPFMNSKLTYLLQPCFEGNSKTLMFVNLSPEMTFSSESLRSLRFAAQVNSCKIGTPRQQRSTEPGSQSPAGTRSGSIEVYSPGPPPRIAIRRNRSRAAAVTRSITEPHVKGTSSC